MLPNLGCEFRYRIVEADLVSRLCTIPNLGVQSKGTRSALPKLNAGGDLPLTVKGGNFVNE